MKISNLKNTKERFVMHQLANTLGDPAFLDRNISTINEYSVRTDRTNKYITLGLKVIGANPDNYAYAVIRDIANNPEGFSDLHKLITDTVYYSKTSDKFFRYSTIEAVTAMDILNNN